MTRKSDTPADEAGASTSATSKKHSKKNDTGSMVPASVKVVKLAKKAFDFYVSTDGEAFAVAKKGPRLVRMFRGGKSSLRAHLSRLYLEKHGRVPTAASIRDALVILEAEAEAQPRVPLHLRVARHKGRTVLDLATPTGEVAVARPGGGWEIKGRSPVFFRRTVLTLPLDEPERGGSLEELRHLLNVKDEDWDLLVAFLVAALDPSIPVPHLLLVGEQGTAKSTAERLIARLFDPSPAETREAPRDLESWAVAASGSYIVPLDNLSGITSAFSDALCRACTGEGVIRRELYSDGGIFLQVFKRIVILTAIDPGALRGDLGERLVLVELERISPDRRLSERQIEDAFSEMHPRILGALLDLVSDVLKVLPEITLDEVPRMADFAYVVAAVDRVRGTNALDAYIENSRRIRHEVVDGDSVALAIEHFMRKRRKWKGTATDLYDLLEAPERDRYWPANPMRLGSRLKRAAPGPSGTRNRLQHHKVDRQATYEDDPSHQSKRAEKGAREAVVDAGIWSVRCPSQMAGRPTPIRNIPKACGAKNCAIPEALFGEAEFRRPAFGTMPRSGRPKFT